MERATESKPNYYAVIPANVRYDSNLSPGARLLYGEISALSQKEGYCWATNSYFAEAYNVSKWTISDWISQLREAKYISVEVLRDENTQEIEMRRMWITDNQLLNSSINNPPTTPEPIQQEKEEKYKDEIKQIIDYLNSKIGSRYRYTSQTNNKYIRARLNEKFTVDDFKKVIDNKVQEWTGTEFQQYLRPETLFGGKFEQYLNQKTYVSPQNQTQRTQWDGTIVGDKVF